ncbi:hypothetical protein [uncultured Thiodictyon sp.]|uniref:hypothetical protein n=1 Tax=uncultured Thiodictyon sp. TaxID=1846217 RepID=UPI0025FFC38C|nr:hypothetical protein [uncultured Thiodictyon sp.]
MGLSRTLFKRACFRPRPILKAAAALALFLPTVSQALPIFARQTGNNCVACHAGGQFPELTAYGRMFKATGYTMGKRVALPLAVMAQANMTDTNKANGPTRGLDFPKNGQPMFQILSLFAGGKILDNLGLFAQVTYDFYNHRKNTAAAPVDGPGTGGWVGRFTVDNIDLRLADRIVSPNQDLIYGMSLNNSPTVEDLWNSTPTWGFPYLASTIAIAQQVAPLVNGLGQQVAGLTAYGYWKQTVYAAVGAYTAANGALSVFSQGVDRTARTQIAGTAPYWRLALTHASGPHDFMIGTYGMIANAYPDPMNMKGPTTAYSDIAIDAQYQYILDPHAITMQFNYTTESVRWDGATWANWVAAPDPTLVSHRSARLNQLNLKGTYAYDAGKFGTFSGTLNYFQVDGQRDINWGLGGFFDPVTNTNSATPITGSRANDPGTRGWIAELSWKPVQYVRLGVQYWLYNTFNGASRNYDGNGRRASDNNTVFVYLWGIY